VPHAHVAAQLDHVPGSEDVAGKAVVLAKMQLIALAGHDARGILPAVLKHEKRIVQRLINRAVTNDPNDAAHGPLARTQPETLGWKMLIDSR
jgi:hypothetical protein